MKRYRSHKVVEAAPIVSAQFVTMSGAFDVVVQGGEVVRCPCEVFARGRPDPGDYLVRYDDGYLSWSPKEKFEAGYTPVEDAPEAGRVSAIARVCHEANRGWCEAIGDFSQLPWAVAPEWQRQSAMNGVRFHLDNPNAPASASHDSWMAEKVATGWVFGVAKDADAKTHPCMVPFDELPPEQQAKDRLFKATVHALSG